MQSGEFLIVPGVYDALSARLAARAGARAIYMSGFGIAGASWGVPDIGLIGPEAMAERAATIVGAATPVPLIADGDNGYGGPANVARLVRAYERGGASAIQLEDQVSPKRCGHMAGKEIVSLDEACAKIRAACAARTSAAFKIVARTDARAVDGLAHALRRCEAFLQAGADILFIEAPESEQELKEIAEAFTGTPLIANLVEDGRTPWLSPQSLQSLGYRIALYPITALLATATILQRNYSEILCGNAAQVSPRLRFQEYNELLDLSQVTAFNLACRQ
ncbi:MAG TPA: isocitrate lyase/PEP mutase family protein [Xanthobacteraceae bacterium]